MVYYVAASNEVDCVASYVHRAAKQKHEWIRCISDLYT